MSDVLELIDYERLTLDELDKASHSTTADRRRDHLNQAAVFATLGEQQRRPKSDR